ncbi:DegT/DnrJ/EryC1/StrS family aminotransferase [Halalkalicoccus subterraneus]|uniref:DegT/DnrJ/EryC1/StrS family aminotransferase n=1 Tax=Halalkalicoccus subterraneus TaxID=2675002 RepID=UPI000EFB07C5|nr:DegT/DnrJ/EryC1/StrS family aminotransferase [Halalkalicoccus subterraneus]
MARSTPKLGPTTVFSRRRAGNVRAYFEDRGAARYSFYGYGKVACRDGIDVLLEERPDADNVVLPAYLPYGIVEPFREAGLEPRYYTCDRELRPDIDGIEDVLDSGTLAVMFVHYFGQPQRRADIDAIRERCREYGAYTIDDNAHAPLSTLDDRLLGTFGDIGITSLRKMLPIPNGAALFVTNETLDERALSRASVRGYTKADWRYCARSFGRVLSDQPVFKQALSTVRNGSGASESDRHVHKSDLEEDPREIYEMTKVPMSRLALRVIDRTEPMGVIAARRANYRAWDRAVRDLSNVEPIFDSLSEGACPQYFPVIVEEPDELGPLAETAKPWPPLPYEIRDADGFGTENYLASHLHTLPVHQGLDLTGLEPLSADDPPVVFDD